MEVIRQEDPSVHRESAFFREAGQTADEVVAVGVVSEDSLPVQPSTDDVMEDTRSIQARCAWHFFESVS
jgi:hypothetical protein